MTPTFSTTLPLLDVRSRATGVIHIDPKLHYDRLRSTTTTQRNVVDEHGKLHLWVYRRHGNVSEFSSDDGQFPHAPDGRVLVHDDLFDDGRIVREDDAV